MMAVNVPDDRQECLSYWEYVSHSWLTQASKIAIMRIPGRFPASGWGGALVFVLWLWILGHAAGAAILCSVCGRAVPTQYLKDDRGRAYCSQACFESLLPKCAVCAKAIKGEYILSDGRSYCGQACFETSLPACSLCGRKTEHVLTWKALKFCPDCADLPRCFQCQIPVKGGVPLADGRAICEPCRQAGIFTLAQGSNLYAIARTELNAATGLSPTSPPPLVLADSTLLRRLNPKFQANLYILRGTYRNEKTTTETFNFFGGIIRESSTIRETIYIMKGLNRENFITCCAHELTHDMIEDRVPALLNAPLWAQEGLCQYAGALVALRNGWTNALQDIRQCDDPVYGNGFRWYVNRFGENQWPAVRRWLDAGDFSGLPP